MDRSPIESIKTPDGLDVKLDDIDRKFNLEFSLSNIVRIREKILSLKRSVEDLSDYFAIYFFEKKIRSGEFKSWAEKFLQKTKSLIELTSNLESDFVSMRNLYRDSKPDVVDSNPNHNDPTLHDEAGYIFNSTYEYLVKIYGYLNQMRKKLSEALEIRDK